MRLVSYRTHDSDGSYHAGIERDGGVVDVSLLLFTHGTRGAGSTQELQPVSVRGLLEKGPEQVQNVLTWAAEQFDVKNEVVPLDAVELGPPIPDPDKIICLAGNYARHLAETGAKVADLPPFPMFFGKYRNSLIGPTDPILLPQVSQAVDYEGELAVVIGKRCREVSRDQALDYVAGYTVCNDVSARDLQRQAHQWMAGKALDTFAPMGPGIVPASEIPDPQALMLITRLNGDVVQHESTADMIFSVADSIAFLSTIMTLEAGDIIATGTPAGVGFSLKPPRFLKDGDIIEVEIEGVGLIRNPVLNQTRKTE